MEQKNETLGKLYNHQICIKVGRKQSKYLQSQPLFLNAKKKKSILIKNRYVYILIVAHKQMLTKKMNDKKTDTKL